MKFSMMQASARGEFRINSSWSLRWSFNLALGLCLASSSLAHAADLSLKNKNQFDQHQVKLSLEQQLETFASKGYGPSSTITLKLQSWLEVEDSVHETEGIKAPTTVYKRGFYVFGNESYQDHVIQMQRQMKRPFCILKAYAASEKPPQAPRPMVLQPKGQFKVTPLDNGDLLLSSRNQAPMILSCMKPVTVENSGAENQDASQSRVASQFHQSKIKWVQGSDPSVVFETMGRVVSFNNLVQLGFAKDIKFQRTQAR